MDKQRKWLTHSEAGRLGAERTRARLHEERSQRIRIYDGNPKLCCFCRKPLSYDKRHNKYCSHRCSAMANNGTHEARRIRRKSCALCGAEVKRSGSKFCSVECASKFRSKVHSEYIEKYIKDTGEFPKSSGIYTGEVYRHAVKMYLVQKHGNVCSICGNTTWMGQPIPLVVDHIDGNALNCSIDNFRLVCGNCDMQLPTYKGRNKGHGRKWRRGQKSSLCQCG